MTEEQLSALLRLKRYEQPPAQYFDRLLQDIHRRQRADLLKLPLWKIALERVQTFFSEHSMSRLAYAGSLASVLVVGVTTIKLMTPGTAVQQAQVDNTPQPPVIASVHVDDYVPTPVPERVFNLQGAGPALATDAQSIRTSLPMFGSAVSPQRYIIDPQPVSYVPNSF